MKVGALVITWIWPQIFFIAWLFFLALNYGLMSMDVAYYVNIIWLGPYLVSDKVKIKTWNC